MKQDRISSVASRSGYGKAVRAVVVGGFIAGVLDLAYAILVYSAKRPILVPQTIASGVLGQRAYHGGAETAVLGVILHFVIAFGAATAYYLASRKLLYLVQRPVAFGLIFGALVYIFMHAIVLPLSAVPPLGKTPLIYKVCEFVWHWFGVGLPISLSVRHYSTGAW